MTQNGLNSLYYFQLRIAGVAKIGQLDRNRFIQIRRFIKTEVFIPWIEAAILIRVPAPRIEDYASIWVKDRLTDLSLLTTKQIRDSRMNSSPLTNLKIGLELDIDVSLTWFHRMKTLRSSRHLNTLLKIIHGDIYSNDRQLRFGLRDNDRCDRCGNADSRVHRIATCPKAIEIWNTLRRLNNQTPLREDDPEILKEILGINEPFGNKLVLNAEILQILINTLDQRINTIPATILLRITLRKLFNQERGQYKDYIKALLDKIDN